MNSRQISTSLNNSSIFRGVFPRDYFLMEQLTDGIYIVNTHPSDYPGEHWFAVECDDRNAFIFDSYGEISPVGTQSEDIMSHIARFCSNIRMNTSTYQSLNTNVCGDYCLFYVFARANGFRLSEIDFALQYFPSSHIRDHVIRHFISNNFSHTLPNTGYGFDRVHVFL